MTGTYLTAAEVERHIDAHPDDLAGELFQDGTFQKDAYLNATQERLNDPTPAKADPEACRRWHLSEQDWAEQMRAVARARQHDAKLDLLREGVTPSA